ncbi:nitroreductase family protein [Clostridium aminobutyricum]|uniref:Nitroreductase family protein n=1 Tax=Clostridium aminobutyricum TaxID=33953 RepID=A0A939DAM5_CLOAM|nr:nitroreductase family protein [Clostridium aminobutyricum]MBN7774210.1 nitroreductase family protein [Clostridium aminobutyricum]
MNAIFKRKSIRKFQKRPVENYKIDLILKAAMTAPSACNQQPWEFYVIRERVKLLELSKISPYAMSTKNATVAIVNCYRNDIEMPQYAEIDLSACTENILLEAAEIGLGAVWLGVAPIKERMQLVREILGIPEHLQPFAIIPIGYPANEAKQENRYDPSRVHYD